jgi:hypothetical protein
MEVELEWCPSFQQMERRVREGQLATCYVVNRISAAAVGSKFLLSIMVIMVLNSLTRTGNAFLIHS